MSSFGRSPYSQQQSGVNPLDYAYADGSPAVAAFFNAVYLWMTVGLALTGSIAWWVSTKPAILASVFKGPTLIILFIAEILLVGVISAAVQRISASVATLLFLVYSALNGFTLSGIFVAYSLPSLAGAFIASAVMFGAMSLYGKFTGSDLTGMGKIAFMGLIGIIVASVVNIFLQSPALVWIVSYVGVAVFLGLTAYDTQRLKQVAISTSGDAAMAGRYAINGALMLYLDFLNLFLMLVQIMGNSRRN
ncbi:MAG: Bax inhibitor-1/YccA family protein [Tepidisphaeraceae bacterium]|jgi:FtsH-binding integral membrane protein